MCGPDDLDCPVDKNFQFPEEAQCLDDPDTQSDDEFLCSEERDPDWEPTAEDLEDIDKTEDDNVPIWHGCIDELEDPISEMKYIVFHSCLLQLFSLCNICTPLI